MKRRKSTGVSRGRVVAWLVGVVALGLILLIAVISVSMRIEMNRAIDKSLEQETAEIVVLSESGIDPATGQKFADVQRFIDVYLSRQVADESELIVGGIANQGMISEQAGAQTPSFSMLSPDTRKQIAVPGGNGEGADPNYGKYTWKSVEIDAANKSGTIALVIFHEQAETKLKSQLLMLLLLGTIILVAIGTVAYWVSGKILGHTVKFEREVEKAVKQGTARLPLSGSEDYALLARNANRLVQLSEDALAEERRFVEDFTFAIRTPITMVQGKLETNSAADQKDALQEVDRLRQLIEDLVLIGRVSRGDYVSSGAQLDLQQLVISVIADWDERISLQNSGVEINYLPSTEPVTVQADAARLRQAIDEIVENAVKVMQHNFEISDAPQKKPITFRLDLLTAESKSWAVLEISDYGRGIPSAECADILHRFATASNDPAPGSGLGLAVANEIVHAMGGQIEVISCSESDRGADLAWNSEYATTVRIKLPAEFAGEE
ncbi:sensor histidine kinase [Arcanobacterium hippocoleae]|uniref:sensor histidine kinase n=1 Tax=Arcanobacterium hippocoleae TaxID=149017 RepID=UPI00333EB7A6